MRQRRDGTTAEELRGAALRVTAERVALLRIVRGGDHLGVAIASGVRDRVAPVFLRAVREALHGFTAAGLVPRVEPVGSPARFEGHLGGQTTTTSCAGRTVSSPTSTARSARCPA